MKRVLTIGVYGWQLPPFLEALRDSGVGLVLDVRQRRGVRGPDYAWANAVRLQNALSKAELAYSHHRELAPTTELRHLQYEEDARQGVGKRSRVELSPVYRERYISEILNRVDLEGFVARLPMEGCSALLCVERDPEACHRSLIADRLEHDHGVAVSHLRPSP